MRFAVPPCLIPAGAETLSLSFNGENRRAISCAGHESGDALRGTGWPIVSLPPRTARRLSEGQNDRRIPHVPFDIGVNYSTARRRVSTGGV